MDGKGTPAGGSGGPLNEQRNRAQHRDSVAVAVNALASVAIEELRSKLATAVGSIPSVAATEIEFSGCDGLTGSSLVLGSAVGPEHIVTAMITVFCPVDGAGAITSLGATSLSGEVREFGGDGEAFQVPVECYPQLTVLRIRGHLFERALRAARIRLEERTNVS
jgi:hypothetical protein